MTKDQLKERFGIDHPVSMLQYMDFIYSDDATRWINNTMYFSNPRPQHKLDEERWTIAWSYQNWLSQPLTKDDLSAIFVFTEDPLNLWFYPINEFVDILMESDPPSWAGDKLFNRNDFIRACEKEGIQLELKE